MIGGILRLAIAVAVAAGVLVLFAYAFLAALIVVPILALLFFLFGRRYGNIWVVGGDAGFRRDEHVYPAERHPTERHPPVIDHDPNDMPPESQKDRR